MHMYQQFYTRTLQELLVKLVFVDAISIRIE